MFVLRRLLLSVVLLTALVPGPITAQAPPDLTLSAESGDPEAQYQLARLYEQGNGVPQDDFAAVRWLTAAAEQDHPAAALDLGWMLANGYGTAKDVERAYFWFVRATALGADGAASQRDALARELTAASRNRLADEALSSLPDGVDAVEIGGAGAPSLNVASDPVLGPGDTLDTLRQQLNAGGGIDILNKLHLLAGDGNVAAANIIGLALRRSTNEGDQSAGLDWIISAARQGLPAAQYNLAAAYLGSADPVTGGAPDYSAIKTWLDAAKRGNRPPDAGDYEALTRAFAVRATISDPYRAAMQGVDGTHRELDELIDALQLELRAREDLDRRLSGGAVSPSLSDIETTIIE